MFQTLSPHQIESCVSQPLTNFLEICLPKALHRNGSRHFSSFSFSLMVCFSLYGTEINSGAFPMVGRYSTTGLHSSSSAVPLRVANFSMCQHFILFYAQGEFHCIVKTHCSYHLYYS